MENFYRLLADPKEVDRWYLKSPIDSSGKDIDPRSFTTGRYYNSESKLNLPLRRHGMPLDFNFCDFDMIVTSKKLNDNLQLILNGQIQRIPVNIEVKNEIYEILNVLDLVSCIDETQSKYLKWKAEDNNPRKTGQYRMISKLIIDPTLAKGHSIFRLKGWEIALIINERIKKLFENMNIKGVLFQSVVLSESTSDRKE